MELSTEEKKQYNRHLILDKIGEAGQLKLKAAKVLVIGAGGLSCPIIQYLSAAGVGHIGIIDNDIVEQSNLQRQILFTHDDIGQHKAQATASSICQAVPRTCEQSNSSFAVQCQGRRIYCADNRKSV